jgi:hypothetical protein
MLAAVLPLKKNIPAHVQAAFKDTDTSYIIAISGFNESLTPTALLF